MLSPSWVHLQLAFNVIKCYLTDVKLNEKFFIFSSCFKPVLHFFPQKRRIQAYYIPSHRRFYTLFSACSASQHRLIHKVEQNGPNDTFRHGFHGCFRSRFVLCSITDKQLRERCIPALCKLVCLSFVFCLSHDML